MTTPPRILTWFASVVFFVVSWQTYALPIAGLTQIRPAEDGKARISVIGDTGYISTDDGIYPINQGGVLPQITPVSSTFGPLIGTTRVVADNSGELFFGANFDEDGFFIDRGTELYSLDDPTSPTVTWGSISSLSGLNSSLQGYAITVILLPDGSTISPIPYTSDDISQFFAGDVTPKGTVLGSGAIPGTIGEGPALLYADGSIDLLSDGGIATSIRDRLDDNGVNVGFISIGESVRYGDGLPIDIDGSLGHFGSGDISVIVSESDFTIVNRKQGQSGERPDGLNIFYPGVNPAGPDRSVPLLDFFPELQTIDFDEVIDASSAGGQIHLLLTGNDGLWLFAAPDPTVVPEPATVTLLGMLVGNFVLRRRQIGAA